MYLVGKSTLTQGRCHEGPRNDPHQQELFFALSALGRTGCTERSRRKVPNLDATHLTNSAQMQLFEHLRSQLQFIFQRV